MHILIEQIIFVLLSNSSKWIIVVVLFILSSAAINIQNTYHVKEERFHLFTYQPIIFINIY